jgi:hypothetical protein
MWYLKKSLELIVLWGQLFHRTAAGWRDCDNKGRSLRFIFQTLPSLYVAFSVLVRFQPVWQLGFFFLGGGGRPGRGSTMVTHYTNYKLSRNRSMFIEFPLLFGSVLESFSRAVNLFFISNMHFAARGGSTTRPLYPPSYAPCSIHL